MHPQTLEGYLIYVQQMSRRLDCEPGALQELLQSIERYKDNASENHSLEEFYKGEYAFYNGQYERALNYFLKAKNVENFEFFCYRTSAFIFKEKGNLDKAFKFVKKALKIYPEDHFSQVLFRDLISKNRHQETQDIVNSEQFQENVPPQENINPSDTAFEYHSRLKISGKEIEELVGIFEARHSEEELFSSEKPMIAATLEHADIFEKVLSPESHSSRNLKQQDTLMNADTNLYSYCSSTDPNEKAILTQRLYSFQDKTSYITKETKSDYASLTPLEGITHLIDEEHLNHTGPIGGNVMNRQTQELELAIQTFNHLQSSLLSNYLERWKSRAQLPDYCLYIFHGWNEPSKMVQDASKALSDSIHLLFAEGLRKQSGGFYLRWNNKGVVINPGKYFIQNMHLSGLYIKDIDYVIVTHDQQETYADIKEIYDLNCQLNQASGDIQRIHYYLNHTIYEELLTILKPHSKQERQAIHRLEFFMDSPETEKVELGSHIQLHYFPITPHAALSHNFMRKRDRNGSLSSILGIRLELILPQDALSLQGKNEKSSINLGYISGVSWSPFAAHQLANCDIILAGIGNTNPTDYNKTAYLDDCLGYFGLCSLLEDISPKLLLCTEFGGREGDIRLEIIKKMRYEYLQNKTGPCSHSVILPADIGLFLDLKTFQIRCSISRTLVDPAEIRVVRSTGNFGPLHYLSPACCL